MTDGISAYYLTQGVLGVTSLVLSIVTIFLYRDRQKLQDKYDAKQDTHLLEVKEFRDKLLVPLERQNEMSEKQSQLSEKIMEKLNELQLSFTNKRRR